MALNGRNIIIKMGGTVIAGTRSHDVSAETEDITVSSPKTGRWRTCIAGQSQWSVTANYLVLTNEGIKDVLKTGNKYELVMQDRDGKYTLSGTAMLKVCKQTYTIGNIAQGTFQFVGDGELR